MKRWRCSGFPWVVSPLLALGLAAIPRVATADPISMYAYSRDLVTNVTVAHAALTQDVTQTENRAAFSGFGDDARSDLLDAKQAKRGPGPFPEENVFAPQGEVGQYARADSLIQSPTPDPDIHDLGANVAEAYRTSPGEATARADVTVFFELEQLTDDVITFEFFANPKMRVKTTGTGVSAFAALSFNLVLFDFDSFDELLDWTPCGVVLSCFTKADRLGIAGVQDPFSLNTSIACQDGPCDKTYFPPEDDTKFSLGFSVAKGQKYRGFYTFSEEVRVVTPEPASLILVGGGALVASALRKRRQRRQRDPV